MTRTIYVGNVPIGGGNRVTVQSMTNTPTADREATAAQIDRLTEAGCDIIRLAVTCDEEVEACKSYIRTSKVPLVADIQFDHRLAIRCSEIGFAKVRINPGNIGGEAAVRELVAACKLNGTPIRIGVNGGSLEKGIVGGSAEAIAESALRNVELIEKFGFHDIVISAKSSDVATMINANRILARKTDLPLHLGVTESGDADMGSIKSAIGIGSLLADGIGDTVRVSLSGDPIAEVAAARKILRAVGADKNFCDIISCPTCSRCNYDLESVVRKVRLLTKDVDVPMKVAVMGCVVNGPGEARDADCGVAGGKDKAALFKHGEIVETIPMRDIYYKLGTLIEEIVAEKK